MMRAFFTTILSLISFFSTIGQAEPNPELRRPIKTDSSRIDLYILDAKKLNKVKPEIKRTYFWLKGMDIYQTNGGFDGSLLHGSFVESYADGGLMQKGQFKFGLKNGIWLKWNKDGKLITKENYQKGLLHGDVIFYSDTAEKLVKYRHGTLLLQERKKKETKDGNSSKDLQSEKRGKNEKKSKKNTSEPTIQDPQVKTQEKENRKMVKK